MKLIIENEVELFDLDEEDFNLLRECSVWLCGREYDPDKGVWVLQQQKITLPADIMEQVLDVFDLHCHYLMNLNRYATARYGWDVTKPQNQLHLSSSV